VLCWLGRLRRGLVLPGSVDEVGDDVRVVAVEGGAGEAGPAGQFGDRRDGGSSVDRSSSVVAMWRSLDADRLLMVVVPVR
jgi:hypothetical protein